MLNKTYYLVVFKKYQPKFNIKGYLCYKTYYLVVFKKYQPKFDIKGYLCYKTITSQNLSSEALVKNFFVL